MLTEDGDRALQSARHTHNDVLRRALFAVTTPAERRMLRRLWQRLSEQRPHPLSPDGSYRSR
jgi:hypothetical protein